MGRLLAFSIASIVILSASLLLAGDGAAGTADIIPDWLKSSGMVAGMAGGPLFAIWYAYYMTTNRIPAIEAVHQKQIEDLQKQHVNYITETNRIHADHISLLTNDFRADISSIVAGMREDEKSLRETLRDLGEKFSCRYISKAG